MKSKKLAEWFIEIHHPDVDYFELDAAAYTVTLGTEGLGIVLAHVEALRHREAELLDTGEANHYSRNDFHLRYLDRCFAVLYKDVDSIHLPIFAMDTSPADKRRRRDIGRNR